MKENRLLDDLIMAQQAVLIDIIGIEEVANSSVRVAFAAMMSLTMKELELDCSEGRDDEIFDGAKAKVDAIVEWIRLQKELFQKGKEDAIGGKSSLV